MAARTRGEDIIDFGMGNPDRPTPPHIVDKLVDAARREVLCDGLNLAGWPVEKPGATMFVWAQIPPRFRAEGSLEFSKRLLAEANVAVSPGIGFGEYGDDHVRFALIENDQRTRQALRGIRRMLDK